MTSTTAKIIADSIADGVRLTTFEVYYPRLIMAQKNTHRVFSRSAESSRAIPVLKRIAMVETDPFIPEAFGKNKRGMQPGELSPEADEQARAIWEAALADMIGHARKLADLGVHKEQANRLLEPFAYVRAIVTSTEWDNFWALRLDSHAQGEHRTLAEAMRAAFDASTPVEKKPGEWHLPYWGYDNGAGQDDLDWAADLTWTVDYCEEMPPPEWPMSEAVKVSCARCARISYLQHDGTRDVDKDLALYERLKTAGHMGALEHAAQVAESASPYWQSSDGQIWGGGQHGNEETADFCGNFRLPWIQHRKMIPGEAVFGSAA